MLKGRTKTCLLQNLSPVRRGIYTRAEREKNEVRRKVSGHDGGILVDDEGILQLYNVGMVKGRLCGIGAEEVDGRPEVEGFEGGVDGRGELVNTLCGEKWSDLTVIELKMELDKCRLSKNGTKSVLAERLKYFVDRIIIAMCKKRKIVGIFTIFCTTAIDVSDDDDVTRNNGNCDLCCKKIFDGKEVVQCERVCSLWFHRY